MSDPGPLLPRPTPVDPAASPEGRARSAMLRKFGLLFRLVGLGVLLSRVRVEEHSTENVRRAAERGPLVYVLHTRSIIDWLALNVVLNRRRLPLAQVSPGLRSTVWRPVVEAAREWVGALRARLRIGAAADPVGSGWFAQAVAEGMPSAIYLTRPRGDVGAMLGPAEADPVAALLDAQARAGRPVQALPVVVAWSRRPELARGEVARFLLGNADEPGPLQKLWMVASGRGQGVVQIGRPLDMSALVERLKGEEPRVQVRAARMLLRRYLYREAHTIRGPRIRPFAWTRRMVLHAPEVRRLIEDEARATGKPAAVIEAKVARIYARMAARMSYTVTLAADAFCRFLFNRIYTGVDIRPEDAERLREAMRAGTPVLVPCHRSHLDYLLVSWVFFQHDLALPYIVAGDNLSFFPLGPVFRRLGAFFIKRSFRGDRVFPVVFERYLRQLVRDGFPVEFFIEGGRSRTGKLLPAKPGVLGMVLDAAAGGRADHAVTFLPIAISYEQIAEERAYARELAGEQKRRESVGQLLRARSVLGRRYGKVFLRVGEPLPAAEIFAEGGAPWASLDREHRAELVQRTGERLLHRIGRELVVLPTGLVALALLAQTRRSIRLDDLHARVSRFDGVLRRVAPHAVSGLGAVGWMVQEALARFERGRLVSRLRDDGAEVIQIEPERRITLEYYKNGLLNHLVPLSFVAAAVRGLVEKERAVTAAEVSRLFAWQVFLFRYEFVLDPGRPAEATEGEAIDALVAYGALERAADGSLRVVDRRLVGEMAELTRNFVESYLLVLRAAAALRSRDISPDALPGKVQEWGKVRLAAEELRRPEALSLVNLQHAARAWREEGVLRFRSDGGGLQIDDATWRDAVADLNLLGLSDV